MILGTLFSCLNVYRLRQTGHNPLQDLTGVASDRRCLGVGHGRKHSLGVNGGDLYLPILMFLDHHITGKQHPRVSI